jgi:hypothetical protein
MKRPRTNPTIPRAQAAANENAVHAAYAENAETIKTMLDAIGKRLKAHRARFDTALATGRTDWGYVGDLGHVATVLTEITDFLGRE